MNYKGVLLVDKPSGMTSHDVVGYIRRKFGRKLKVGHAGTLDPFATGLLIVLLGEFTKKSPQYSAYDKEYEGVIFLGVSTDTGDTEGTETGRKDIASLRAEDLEGVFSQFRGTIEQVPPMFSAKKIKGKRLYKLARRGITVERIPKTVNIKKIEMRDFSPPRVSFYVSCSKGTYIRQLAADIGERLGCGAHLESLRRTAIGPFRVEGAVLPGEIENNESILQPK